MKFSTVAVASFLFSLARCAALQSRASSGQATFYGGNLHGGSCSFSTYTLPSGMYGTALSDSNWADAANCGACISVTGPGGNSIAAMIVDQCPGCGMNHLDLFPDAFAVLANPTTGVIDVTWSIIDCGITSPLQLHNKDGVSQYWFSMQVVNADKAVSTLEVSTDGGASWTGTTRQSYNFFQYDSGFGTTFVDVRITSVDGDVIVVNSVEVASGASTTATSNFGSGGAAVDVSSVAAPSPMTLPAETTPSPTVAVESAASTTTDAAGIFEPSFSSSDEAALPSPTPTLESSDDGMATATTMATFYTPYSSASATSTAEAAAVSTVTVYSYESCTY